MGVKNSLLFKSIKLVILASIALIICAPVKAQLLNPEFQSYNTQDGLPQNWVLSIAQDKNGFMWFGTDDGLSRFDGHEFKVLKHIADDSNSIINNSILALFIDEVGSIWIGTNNGICRYFPETERIQRFPIDYTKEENVNGSQVSSIQKDVNGSIWITYIGDGIDVITPGKKEVLHYTINRKDDYTLKNDIVSSLLLMPDNYKIIGTLSGIEVIGDDGLVLNEKQALEKYPWKNLIDNSIKCFQLSKDKKTIWIGTELNGLYRVELETNRVVNYNKDNSKIDFNHILSLYEDSKGNLWVGSEALYFFDPKTNDLILYNEYFTEEDKVLKNPVYSIFEDKDNNIWMGTYRMGALKYNPIDAEILHYHTNKDKRKNKISEILSFMEDDAGEMWVGTGGGGLVKLNEELMRLEESALNQMLNLPVIRCIYKDSSGYFWMGTWDNGLIKYHPVTHEMEHFHPDNGNFKSLHVWDIAEGEDGNLWLGTLRDGLCYFSTKTGKYKYYKNIPGDSASLINDDILSLYKDTKNNLWVGTGNGLSVRYSGSNKFKNLLNDPTKPSISSNIIVAFFEDHAGKIWFGTNGGGITIVNKDLSIVKILTDKDGLPSNTVTAIESDSHNDIWMSTYKGLAKIRYKDLSVIGVPQITGLLGKEYIYRSNYKTKDGKLIFGGVEGFDIFYPDSLNYNPKHEKILFTSLKVFNDEIKPNTKFKGRVILDKSITETDEIRLSYKDYSFTITFAPITYNWQKSLRYSYFMENLDKEWQQTTSDRRFVHYTNLAPGEYTLKVKASFDGKTWPNAAQTLRIYIAPPWWATFWFRIGAFIFGVLFLFSIYRIRVRFLRKQSKKLENLVLKRTAELEKSNLEIQKLLEEVASQKKNIEDQNTELQKINEELEAQRDDLAVKSIELEKAQFTLREINASLEQLVNKRTEKLNDTFKELETFLYRASHDLRGPIMSMLGLINLGQVEQPSKDNHKIYYGYLHKSVIKLERTLQKLLEKHTILKIKVAPQCFNKYELEVLLEIIIRDIKSFRRDDFEVKIPDALQFQTDKTLLCILLTNLLENAFLFSQKSTNKKVVLEFNVDNGRINITVRDFGIGIKQKIQDRIFSMFYRGSELSNGNGLGLYLVKSVLEKLDGTIALESEEGNYSCFKVTL